MRASPHESLPYRGKWLVRALGTILLVAAALMLVLGLTVLTDRLQGPRFVLYWSWCFLIATAAILVAMVDLVLIRRASQRSKHELLRRHFLGDETESGP